MTLSHILERRPTDAVPLTLMFTPDAWDALEALREQAGASDLHYLIAHALECYHGMVELELDGYALHALSQETGEMLELEGVLLRRTLVVPDTDWN